MGWNPLDLAHGLAIATAGQKDGAELGSRRRRSLWAMVVWIASLPVAYIAGGVTRTFAVSIAVLLLALLASIAIAAGPRRLGPSRQEPPLPKEVS